MEAERKEGEAAVEFWECPGLPSGDQDDSLLSLVLGRNVKELISLLWSVIGCESPGEIDLRILQQRYHLQVTADHTLQTGAPPKDLRSGGASTASTTLVCYSPQNWQTKPTVLCSCWNRR